MHVAEIGTSIVINDQTLTNKEAHQLLWGWLAKHPSKTKDDFYEQHNITRTSIFAQCFACKESAERNDKLHHQKISNCQFCPIDWGVNEDGEPISCVSDESPMELAYIEPDKKIRSQLYQQIADLPWSDTYVERNPDE